MDFSALTAYLDSLRNVNIPACDLIVYRDHRMIYRHMAGFRDAEKCVPLNGEETYNVFSCTKVMTTCAVMQLISRGLLKPDDQVCDYLPAFTKMYVNENGKLRPAAAPITIRHLLSMQSGLDYDIASEEILKENALHGGNGSTPELVNAIAKKPLRFEPGTDFLYSLSHDVLAAVIETVTGMRFSDYLRENIWNPLGLKRTAFVPTEDMAETLTAQWRFEGADHPLTEMRHDDNGYRLSPVYESGGAGLISCTADYALFADALACGGRTADGTELLPPDMIRLWSTPQLCERAQNTFDGWKRVGYSYALGVRTRTDITVGRRGSIGEFGWDGAAGAYLFADPSLRLSGYFSAHVRNYSYNYDVIHPTLQTLIYDGLDK